MGYVAWTPLGCTVGADPRVCPIEEGGPKLDKTNPNNSTHVKLGNLFYPERQTYLSKKTKRTQIGAQRRPVPKGKPSDMKMQNKAKSVQSAKFYALGTVVPVFVQNKPKFQRFQSKIKGCSKNKAKIVIHGHSEWSEESLCAKQSQLDIETMKNKTNPNRPINSQKSQRRSRFFIGKQNEPKLIIDLLSIYYE